MTSSILHFAVVLIVFGMDLRWTATGDAIHPALATGDVIHPAFATGDVINPATCGWVWDGIEMDAHRNRHPEDHVQACSPHFCLCTRTHTHTHALKLPGGVLQLSGLACAGRCAESGDKHNTRTALPTPTHPPTYTHTERERETDRHTHPQTPKRTAPAERARSTLPCAGRCAWRRDHPPPWR